MSTMRWAGVLMAAAVAAGVMPPAGAAERNSPEPVVERPHLLDRTVSVPARQALGMSISELNVDGVALGKVIQYLRDVSGTNITVNWRALEGAGVDKSTPVTLAVNDVSLRKALKLVMDTVSPSTGLTWMVDQNVITVTTQEEADKAMIIRVYTVDDLVMTNPQVKPAPTMDLQAITRGGTTTGGQGGGTGMNNNTGLFQAGAADAAAAPQETSQKRGEDLVKLIQEVVRPEIWRDNGGQASIRYFSGKLIVTAPLSVQEAIGGPVLR